MHSRKSVLSMFEYVHSCAYLQAKGKSAILSVFSSGSLRFCVKCVPRSVCSEGPWECVCCAYLSMYVLWAPEVLCIMGRWACIYCESLRFYVLWVPGSVCILEPWECVLWVTASDCTLDIHMRVCVFGPGCVFLWLCVWDHCAPKLVVGVGIPVQLSIKSWCLKSLSWHACTCA